MVLSLVFVRLHYFGWSPVYDCKTYLETNIVQNCSYFGFGGYFLVVGKIFWSLTSRVILGDPGADSGGEGKSKRAEKIWHVEK